MGLRRSQISRCFICEGEAGAPATVAEKSKQTHDNPFDYAPCYPFSLLHPFNCDGLHVENRSNRISDACVSCTYMVHSRQEYSRGEDDFFAGSLATHSCIAYNMRNICRCSRVFYACFPVWIKRSSSNQRRRLAFSPTNLISFGYVRSFAQFPFWRPMFFLDFMTGILFASSNHVFIIVATTWVILPRTNCSRLPSELNTES